MKLSILFASFGLPLLTLIPTLGVNAAAVPRAHQAVSPAPAAVTAAQAVPSPLPPAPL
ncbi:hypothetical protein HDU98_011140, partial [Podochytrium sp. JEL0797]